MAVWLAGPTRSQEPSPLPAELLTAESHYQTNAGRGSGPPRPREELQRWSELLQTADATADFETYAFVAANVAQDWVKHRDAVAASDLLQKFGDRADQASWTLRVWFWRVAADVALQANRANIAIAHCERGLTVASTPPSRDDAVHVAGILLTRAQLRQRRGEVGAARRDILQARNIAGRHPDVSPRLVIVTADQCLLTEDHDLAESSLEALAELANGSAGKANAPIVELYRAVILASLPQHRNEAREALRRVREDDRLLPQQRELAAGLSLQTAMAADMPVEDLRAELESVTKSFPKATATKLVSARAEAWLRHGDDSGLSVSAIQEEVAAALRASTGPAMSPTHLGRLWNDDLAWLVNVAVRLHWLTHAGGDWRGALSIALSHEAARNGGSVSREQLEQLRREHAPANGVLLVYLAGRFSTAVLVLTATRADLVEDLPRINWIRHCVDDALAYLRATARSSPSSLTEGCLTDLRQALLPKRLWTTLQSLEQLTIARIGRFEQIPFDALPVGARSAGETWAINHATELLTDLRRARPQPAGPRALRVIGSLTPAPQFAGKVGGAKQLARAMVTPCLAPTNGEFTGDATPADVFGIRPPPLLAQIIGHGVAVLPGDSRLNGIALSPDRAHPDGLLLEAPADWRAPTFVILSACDHATAETIRGEHQLTSTFAGVCLRQGAVAVLAPLGGVQLGPHLELLARVHVELKADVSLAKALWIARRAKCPDMSRAERAQALLLAVYGNGHQAVFTAR